MINAQSVAVPILIAKTVFGIAMIVVMNGDLKVWEVESGNNPDPTSQLLIIQLAHTRK